MRLLLSILLFAATALAQDKDKITFEDMSRDLRFQVDGPKTLLIITHDGKIKLNRKDFPNLTPDDFARKFAKILESITVQHNQPCVMEGDNLAEIKAAP